MMTKNKSGFAAKLKALLVIPAALAVFILFANLTIKSKVFSFHNYEVNKEANFNGIWKNTTEGSYATLLSFSGNQLSILEDYSSVNILKLKVKILNDRFIVQNPGRTSQELKYEFIGSQLKVWWGPQNYGLYDKTSFNNSSELILAEQSVEMQLPMAHEYRVLDQPKYLLDVFITPKGYQIDGKNNSLNELNSALEKAIESFNVLDRPYITTRIIMDSDGPMKQVYHLFKVMRSIQLYKVAYAVLPENDAPLLQYHVLAIPQKLPPADAEMLEESEVLDRLFKFSSAEAVRTVASNFERYVKEHSNYIGLFEWDNKTPYGDYIALTDMTYRVIYKLRNTYSQQKYQVNYLDLPIKLQKEVRKFYRLRITQRNTDEDK